MISPTYKNSRRFNYVPFRALVSVFFFCGMLATASDPQPDTLDVDMMIMSLADAEAEGGTRYEMTLNENTISAWVNSYGSESRTISLTKGEKYSLTIDFYGTLYYDGGYLASLSNVGIFMFDDSILGVHGNGDFGGSTDVYVPLIALDTVTGAAGREGSTGGGDGFTEYAIMATNVVIQLSCLPNEDNLPASVPVSWLGIGVGDGLTRSITLDGTNMPTGEVTASFGDEVVFKGSFINPNGISPSNPTIREVNEVDKPAEASSEPINTRTGNNYFTEKRMSAPCHGIPLELDLAYKSVTSLEAGSIGNGWFHSYDWSLDTAGANPVLRTGGGEKFTFGVVSNGTYISPAVNNWGLLERSDGYDVCLPAGLAYRFDPDGKLSAIIDAWSNRVDCAYDGNDCLESVTHSNGRGISFSNAWNSAVGDYRVASIEMTDGASLGFAYDGSGQFTQIVERVDNAVYTSQYQYANGYLTNRVNGAGFEYQYGYASGTGRGTSLSVDGYYAHEVDYVGDDTTEITYSARGMDQVHRYSYGAMGALDTHYGPSETAGGVTSRGISYEYDPSGSDITKEVLFDNGEANGWAQFKLYDSAHNVTNVLVSYGGAPPTSQLAMEYDPVWNLPSAIIDGDGSRMETVYTNGLPTVTKAFYSGTGSHDTHYSYYTNGLLRAVTNANQHVAGYGYDGDGNLSSVTPQAGPIVTNTYDALGFLKTTEFYVEESQFVLRRVTEYDRDAKGRVELITYPDGLTSSFEYNALGYLTNSVDRASRVTDYTYAPTKKLTSVTRYLAEGGSNVPVRVSYDLDEQVNVLSIKEPRGRYVESYKLDVQDRVTSVTNIENQVMGIDYGVGGFVKSVARFDGSVITNTYDGAGRLSSAAYNPEGPDPLVISYGYHADSQIKDVGDDAGTNSYVYNLLNQLTSHTSSVSSVTSIADYLYDAVGNSTNATVSYGGVVVSEVTSTYDEGERLQMISTPVPNATTNSTFTHGYNPRNGALATVENPVSGIICSYGYDFMERLDSISYRTSGGALIKSIDYLYDNASMITNKTITSGAGSVAYAYEYDSIDRLRKETRTAAGTSPVLMEYDYDLAGNRTVKTGNGAEVSYALGSGNRLSSWSADLSSGDISADVRGYSSELIGTDDRWGEILVSNLTTQIGAEPQADGYNFNAVNMPMQLGTNEFLARIRDAAGNVGADTATVVYTVVTNGSYLYNAAGCVTNIAHAGTGGYGDSVALEWDERYRLTSVDDGSSVVEYGYDVLNRKTSRTKSGNSEYYAYDGNQIVADVDGDDDLLRSYVWGVGIDNLLSITTYGTATNTYYAIKDHQNTVLALVDDSGGVVESYEYDAYGRTKVFGSSGSELTASAYGNRYCFQGREIDWDTGLYYFRARWYDAETGRWLSKDPIGISGGLNLYEFCGSNPVNFIDPMGLCENKTDLAEQFFDPTAGFYISGLGGLLLPEPGTSIYGIFSILQGLFVDIAGDGNLDGNMIEGYQGPKPNMGPGSSTGGTFQDAVDEYNYYNSGTPEAIDDLYDAIGGGF